MERSNGCKLEAMCCAPVKKLPATRKMGMKGNKESVRGVVGEQKKQHRRMYGVRIVLLKNIELLKLGYRIRGARKVLGYSQKVFAAKCGLDGVIWEE